MGTLWRFIWAFSLVLAFEVAASGRSLPAPEDYGKVMIGKFSREGPAPVRFDHWLHRSFYTCRLCHVDIGFAMEGGATGITRDTNAKGFHCGACHNGRTLSGGKRIFPSCSSALAKKEGAGCARCHSPEKNDRTYRYGPFAAGLPKQALGDLIDWEEAEARSLVNPVDELPELDGQHPALAPQADFSIASRGTWMVDIIFSHKKHAQWNGCEVCHPEVFPAERKGPVKYSMFEISEGRYCGLCHDRVAFPLNDCDKCHSSRPGRSGGSF